MMIKRAFLPVVASALIAVGALASGPTWFWVTLYDGGKAVQVWVTTEEPKVSGDTCRFVPQGQKNVTVIHACFRFQHSRQSTCQREMELNFKASDVVLRCVSPFSALYPAG
jgi:hypothetical protein